DGAGYLITKVKGRRGSKAMRHKKLREQRIAPLLPRLVPSPRYFAKIQLLQLLVGSCDASQSYRGRCAVVRRIVLDHAVFVRAEAAHATLVKRCRRAADGIAQVRRATSRVADAKVVAALRGRYGAGLRKRPVNQASIGHNRASCRATGRGWRSEHGHAGCVAGRRVGGKKA